MAARRVAHVVLVALLFGTLARVTPAHAQPANPIPTSRVDRVVDGDTLVVEGVGTVRLIGVDTPETVDPRKPVEYFGLEASAFLKRLVEGQTVRLEYDQQRTDRYGRTLAYVYLADGTFVNAEIVRQGYGHAYTEFPFKHLELFRDLEHAAMSNNHGLLGGRMALSQLAPRHEGCFARVFSVFRGAARSASSAPSGRSQLRMARPCAAS